MKYGVLVTYECWATVDGGPDLVGEKEELEAAVQRWRAQPIHPDQRLLFKVKPYTGIDPADRGDVVAFLDREASR